MNDDDDIRRLMVVYDPKLFVQLYRRCHSRVSVRPNARFSLTVFTERTRAFLFAPSQDVCTKVDILLPLPGRYPQ
ncbi:hypothetical protein [Natrialba magadii]|uniref:hypothetical protein n=1 Tax=Natrialba magadii TaxID=13769 RepID=UPI0011D11662|nr:hypothetical protein [Natrialba magadii]